MNGVVNILILVRFIIRQMTKIKCDNGMQENIRSSPVNTGEKWSVCV